MREIPQDVFEHYQFYTASQMDDLLTDEKRAEMDPLEEDILLQIRQQKHIEEAGRVRKFIEAYKDHTRDYIQSVVQPNVTSQEERKAVEILLQS